MDLPTHAQTPEEALASVQGNRNGLPQADAEARLAKQGENALPKDPPARVWRIALRQFMSPLMLVLIVAAVGSVFLHEQLEAIVIAAAALLNAVVGFAQEWRASQALERLRSLIQPACLVRRDGKEQEIPAQKVVPGDILILRAGDRIAADARVIAAFSLEANEAALTGESLPVSKQTAPVTRETPLAERSSCVYAGTLIAAGRGEAVVMHTGVDTELGRVAMLVHETKDSATPLQAELLRLSRWIALAAVLCAIVIFFASSASGQSMTEAFKVAVAVAVGAVPEGLLLSVTVVLAVGMQRILARGSLVRRLVAAETLGSVSVICTDKTGTLTAGEMHVTSVIPASGREATEAAQDSAVLLKAAVLCNDAGEGKEAIGSPTETALLEAAKRSGIDPAAVRKQHPRFAELPFDSARKLMATVNAWGKGRALLMKGAPERILPRCQAQMVNGSEAPMDAGARRAVSDIVKTHADAGARVLAVAYRSVDSTTSTVREQDLDGAVLLGFFVLSDPLREDAKQAIEDARGAGIRTVLVTGDHPNTARAIAQQAGIDPFRLASDVGVVTGIELDQWTDANLTDRIESVAVFARVEPRHKIRIISAWKARGAVVAMTGDGVNDAPALKAADIGVALGSGTDAAKEASDIVLLDDRLSTVTAAVSEGRVIFDNIRKMTVYLLADSFTEIVLIGGAIIAGLPLPLTALQILWINLVADSLPNAALTLEPGEPGVMRAPPRARQEPVLNTHMLFLILVIGLVTDLILLVVYMFLLGTGEQPDHIRTVMFAAVGIDSLVYVFAVRSFKVPLWRVPLRSNPWLLVGVAIGFGLMALALFFPPLSRAFGNTALNATDIGILLALSVLKVAGIEGMKAIWNRRSPTVVQPPNHR